MKTATLREASKRRSLISTRAFVEQIMGLPVSVHVRSIDTNRSDIEGAVANVFAHLRKIDAVFSVWRPDSDVMRMRRGHLSLQDAHPWVAEVAALTKRAEVESDGFFTTDLIGPDGTRGWDPTGLVKGWGVSGAAQYLREVQAISFSINAGGDIVCGDGRGMSETPSTWRIGIQDPRDPMSIARVLTVSNGAVATSGSAARGAHIFNPHTGQHISRASSVTVTGPELAWCDMWATACFVAGPSTSLNLPSAYQALWTSEMHFPSVSASD